jgi:hypothetical protein
VKVRADMVVVLIVVFVKTISTVMMDTKTVATVIAVLAKTVSTVMMRTTASSGDCGACSCGRKSHSSENPKAIPQCRELRESKLKNQGSREIFFKKSHKSFSERIMSLVQRES